MWLSRFDGAEVSALLDHPHELDAGLKRLWDVWDDLPLAPVTTRPAPRAGLRRWTRIGRGRPCTSCRDFYARAAADGNAVIKEIG